MSHRAIPSGSSRTSFSLTAAGLLLAAAAGCSGDSLPRVVLAEFQDETPDGIALPDESILLELDRPLSPDVPLETIHVRSDPPHWVSEVQRTSHPRELKVRIVSGSPDFCFDTAAGKNLRATELCVDMGGGVEDRVHLQIAESLPVLQRAVWEDKSGPAGNLVVDRGDWLRLIFDRPVTLTAEGPTARVRSPQDIILSKANDRLDDGEIHARFEKGKEEHEVLIILGSRPVLTIAGTFSSGPTAADRFGASTPSGIAVNGTSILPMPKITHRRGGPGAVSTREIDIEYGEGIPLPRSRSGEAFPPPGHRAFHTLVPIVGGRALIVGGSSLESREALDQVLLYDPSKLKKPAFVEIGSLPHPAYYHSSTLLPGLDGALGTSDDVVIVAGGTSAARNVSRSLPDLTALLLDENGGVEVKPLEEGLRVPRAEHAAVALPGNSILVDGGRTSGGEGPSGILGCAELITFGFEGRQPKVTDHQVFRSLARMRHTLTLLPPADSGELYVLAYGGYGRRRNKPLDIPSFGERIEGSFPQDVFLSWDEGAVLVSPVLMSVRSPARSIDSIPYEFAFALPRWGHFAAPVEPAGAEANPAWGGAGVVLIAGGTARHMVRGFDGDIHSWEMPLEVWPHRPRGHEAASAILFRFNSAEPARSRLEVIPHPFPDPGQATERIHLAHVMVPGLGVFILGGEQPSGGRDTNCTAGVEVFLQDGDKLAELAVPLATARSRHQAYYVDTGEVRSILLLGGLACTQESTGFPDVEEIPLK